MIYVIIIALIKIYIDRLDVKNNLTLYFVMVKSNLAF